MAKRAKVLDSWAIMAFLEDEPAAAEVEKLFIAAQEDGSQLIMSTVNLGEVWYSLARASSGSNADEGVRKILRIGVFVVDADWELARQAAFYKSRNKLAYADCFAGALAKLRNGELVTGDKEFKQLEGEIRIRWLSI